MSFYTISYDQLRQSPHITEMLRGLERGFEKFNIDFFLVGAMARDVWLSGIHKKQPRRVTSDIDFAISLNDKSTYQALKEYLIEEEGFYPLHDNAFILKWMDRFQVDLLPFGTIADEDGIVKVDGTGLTTAHVPGFNEVYETGLPQLELGQQHIFKFCTLPGIVILKLISWDDRPEVRSKDIIDISDILHHYFDMNDENIWEQHHDLFSDDNFSLPHIAARVMGREMRKIAKRNHKIYQRLIAILKANIEDVANSRAAAVMVIYYKNTMKENVEILKQLKQGLEETSETKPN